MLVDRYQPEDIFVRVPQMTARIDPVLVELDQLLDDDELYQAVRADFGKRHRRTLVAGPHLNPRRGALAHAVAQTLVQLE